MTDETNKGDERGRQADKPSEIPAKGWKDIAKRVGKEMKDDHAVLSAAGVAFYGFLAAIPALAALVSLYGLFADPGQVQSRVEDLFGALPEDARTLLTSQLKAIVSSSGGSLTFGLIIGIMLSLWSASSGVSHLIEAMNVAYDEHDHRKFWKVRGLALLLTLGAVVFIVFAIGVIAALPAALGQSSLPGAVRWLLRVLVWPVLAVGFAFGIGVLYRYGPDRDEPKWRWVSWGAVVAVVLWIVASIVFQVYTANFGSYNKTYGSLAAVVVLMMWLFITALVIIVGAEINAEMEHQTAKDTTEGPERPLGQRDAEMADTVGEAT
jgi:membrane protein